MIVDTTYTDEFDDTAYRVVGSVTSGGSCDWSEQVILERVSDGALFYSSDSGCSCNYFGEGGLSLTPVNSIKEGIRISRDPERMARSVEARKVVWDDE